MTGVTKCSYCAARKARSRVAALVRISELSCGADGFRHAASICHMPQARQWKVASSGRPSNRAVRLASRMNCAQLGQRGVTSVELGALVSHMVVVPGLWRA